MCLWCDLRYDFGTWHHASVVHDGAYTLKCFEQLWFFFSNVGSEIELVVSQWNNWRRISQNKQNISRNSTTGVSTRTRSSAFSRISWRVCKTRKPSYLGALFYLLTRIRLIIFKIWILNTTYKYSNKFFYAIIYKLKYK